MWVTMDRDVLTEEYGFLPAGKNRNINTKLAEELIVNKKAHPMNEKKAIKPDENKAVKPPENK